MIVDVSHYKDVIKFADEEEFRFTVKAEQKIKDYIEQMSKVKTAANFYGKEGTAHDREPEKRYSKRRIYSY